MCSWVSATVGVRSVVEQVARGRFLVSIHCRSQRNVVGSFRERCHVDADTSFQASLHCLEVAVPSSHEQHVLAGADLDLLPLAVATHQPKDRKARGTR